jgi:hypothetical protein
MGILDICYHFKASSQVTQASFCTHTSVSAYQRFRNLETDLDEIPLQLSFGSGTAVDNINHFSQRGVKIGNIKRHYEARCARRVG